jgi:hypothetical protein
MWKPSAEESWCGQIEFFEQGSGSPASDYPTDRFVQDHGFRDLLTD